MNNSDHFLQAFSSIERFLRLKVNSDNYPSFYQLVDKVSMSNSVVKAFKNDLKEYADLRNAIVHERSDGHIIAEPNDRAVKNIKHIESVIISPPKVIPKFQKSVALVQKDASIGDAVKLMLEHSFSQIPVLDNGIFSALLTANTITRWLGACVSEEIFSLKETPIQKVLEFTEDRENHKFISRNTTMFEVLESFQAFESRGKQLDALLITDGGKQTEKIIGIITVSDLPTIIQVVE
ncbi:MAG: CBS domain-containing protein [Microcystis sp. LE19-84.1B]|jgi:CBS domain-containing protein|uniref:Putative transcriptional regulator, XRE family n=1 Tax=Microcystis aeruginosa PCC 9443 TaxID=1160281 RepID=I4FZE7_MICAE|nr:MULTISPECIES: CBS domain-containing protein [Microcystis]MCZ8225284.1 CBS domain-containing protein [Microcystis sp. LE19-84.1B]CCI01058.1 putative transcriptional regulator, XRE family [Microcystis aeruginosa PCC 9443]